MSNILRQKKQAILTLQSLQNQLYILILPKLILCHVYTLFKVSNINELHVLTV